MAEEEVGLRLSLKNRREVAAGVHQVGDELDRVGDQAAQVNRQSRIASRGIAGIGRAGRTAGRIAAMGIGAIVGATVAAGYAATKLVKSSLSEAREAQKVSAVTRAEIKATGGVANVTARSMSRLAGAISRKVGMDDEAIQSGANLLLTFKNIRNEQGKGNKIFDQATKAAVNLSAAGFGSIESGSKMLGKALNDPLKGITALGRAGVTFTAGQIERIKGFVEENKLLAAQKVILGEVRSQVGGVAAEQATWGDKADVLWGNIQESLGTALLPMLDRVSRWFVRDGGPQLERYVGIFEDKGIPMIERWADLFLNRGIPAIKRFYDKARPVAEDVLPEIGAALGTVRDVTKKALPYAVDLVEAFNDMPDWAKYALVGGVAAGGIGKKLGLGSLLSRSVGTIASTAKPVPVIVMNKGWDVPGGGPGRTGGPAAAATRNPLGRLGTAASASVLSMFGTGAAFAAQGVAGSWFADRVLRDAGHDKAANDAIAVRSTGGQGGMASPFTSDDMGSGYDKVAKGVASLKGDLPETLRGVKDLNKQFEAMMLAAGFGETKVRGLEDGLVDVASQRPTPRIVVTGIPESRRDVDGFIRGPLKTVEARPWTAVVDANTSPATVKVDYLGRMIAGLSRTVTVDLAPRGFGARANGGPVVAGRPYVVGEKHPELFIPRTDGYVKPTVPDMPSFDDADWGADGAGATTVVIPVNLDGHEIAQVVVDNIQDRLARV